MSLGACFDAAVRQGLLSAEEADYFKQREKALREQLGSLKAVRDILAKELEIEALHKRRRALLNHHARERMEADGAGYRRTDGVADEAEAFKEMHQSTGVRGTYISDAAFNADVIANEHLSMMSTALRELKRGALTGDRRRQGGLLGNARVIRLMEDVVRELHGEKTGSDVASKIAREWEKVSESLRGRFNEAGGAIGKLGKWTLVQHHDAEAMLKIGKPAWIERLMRSGVLDRDRMRHWHGQMPMGDGELRTFLGGAYDSILEEYFNKRPDGAPRGVLASQRADHRAIHFANADQWLAYSRELGRGGDIFGDMMAHIEGMSRDIGHMERFGANPEANREWMKQRITERAAGLKDQKERDRVASTLATADAMWELMRGQSPVNTKWADRMATARNIVTASSLPGAVVSALGDISTQNDMRRRFGMGFMRSNLGTVLFQALGELVTMGGREAATEAWLGLDSARNVMRVRASEVARIDMRAWSGFVADRVLTTTLLSPLTQAYKHNTGREIMVHAGRMAAHDFGALPQGMQQIFERNGIGRAEWEEIRASPRRDGGPLRPGDIEAHAGRLLAERYAALVLRETRLAVPEATFESRAFLTSAPAGTFTGEMMRSIGQFKGYSLAVLFLHGARINRAFVDGNKLNAVSQAATLAITMTMVGVAVTVLKDIRDGKDPRRWLDEKAWLDWRLWGAAWLQSGGLGIYGDFLYSAANRRGGGVAETLAGPLAGKVGGVLEGLGEARKAYAGEKANFSRWGVRVAKENLPGFWAHPMTKLAFERQVWDQLELLADREAYTRFRTDALKVRKDYGQEYWWPKGQIAPSRGPDVSRVLATR